MTHVCNFRSAWPIGHPLPPVNPDRLQGPEVGTICTYTSHDGSDVRTVEVLERSYVWSPGECRHKGGNRLYNAKVVRDINQPSWRVVVNDSQLEVIA